MARGDLTVVMDSKSMIKLQLQLSRLTELEKQETVAKGVRQATAIIKKQGQENLSQTYIKIKQDGSGFSKHTFINRADKKKLKGYSGFIRRKGYHGQLAHLLDRGTVDRYTKKGAYRGKMRYTGFWTKAVETKGDEAMKVMAESIQKTIKMILNRN